VNKAARISYNRTHLLQKIELPFVLYDGSMCTKLWERLESGKLITFLSHYIQKLILGSRVAGFIGAEVDLTFGYLGILEFKNEIFSNIIYYTVHSVLHVSIHYALYILAEGRVILH